MSENPLVFLRRCNLISHCVHLWWTGRKTAGAKVDPTNDQTVAPFENSSQASHRSPSSGSIPPNIRAAELMEMRKLLTAWLHSRICLCTRRFAFTQRFMTGRKAAEAQAMVSEKAQLAAQAAAAYAQAKGSGQDIIGQREVGALKSIDVQSFCVMSYEGNPTEPNAVMQQPHHEQQEEENNKKHMLAHFAHALAQVFGGSSGEAAFMSKAGFALDKLFRSFGRSKPGRGMLSFPEFAGALRHTVSQHTMDKRYVEVDVVADVFMVCDANSDGYVSDVDFRDFLLQHRRDRQKKLRQKSQVARRKQAPRFRGPPPRRGQRLPRVHMGPKPRVKIAPGLGLNRGVRSGVRGRRRRQPRVTDRGADSRYWVQQRDAALRRARDKAASVNSLHVRCAPVARRLLAAQTLQGWAQAFCRYDRTRARCMQWREVCDRFRRLS